MIHMAFFGTHDIKKTKMLHMFFIFKTFVCVCNFKKISLNVDMYHVNISRIYSPMTEWYICVKHWQIWTTWHNTENDDSLFFVRTGFSNFSSDISIYYMLSQSIAWTMSTFLEYTPPWQSGIYVWKLTNMNNVAQQKENDDSFSFSNRFF